jgi:hypothetical protein
MTFIMTTDNHDMSGGFPPPQPTVRQDIASLRRWCDEQDRLIHERMVNLAELADAALTVTLTGKIPEPVRRQQATRSLHLLRECLQNAADMGRVVMGARAQTNDIEDELDRRDQTVRDKEKGVL